jgi:hypothetical protein
MKFECNGIKDVIDYSAGVQQCDNMPPVLILFIMHAFMDTIKDEILPSELSDYPERKNGNQKSLNGCLIGQPTQKGTHSTSKNHSMWARMSSYTIMM